MILSFSTEFHAKDFLREVLSWWYSGEDSISLLTSGTSGEPKAVELSRELLIWSAQGHKESFNLKKESLLNVLPIDKAGGFMQIIRALVHNWDIQFEQPSLDLFHHRTKASVTSLSPQQLYHNINSPILSQFKLVLIGGAAIPQSLKRSALEFGQKNKSTRLVETYGMTETASHIAYRDLGEEWFEPIQGVKLSIKEDCLNIEIPELSFSYLSGDIAMLENGKFKIAGRKDYLINSGGIKIHPEQIEPQIEKILEAMGINREFYMTKRPHEELGESAVLLMKGEPIKNEAFVLEVLKRELPVHHHPKRIEYHPDFQYTSTGKLKRNSL